MNLDRIEALVGLFQEARVSELVVEGEAWRVGLRKHPPAPAPARPPVAPAPEEVEPVVARPPRPVTAARVGLFRAADPPVRAGDHVVAGQPVGSIDSMGILNPVTAPVSGRVMTVAVAEGEGVQYGQMLFQLVEDGEPTAGV